MGNKAIMHANVPEEVHRMYNWSFYIHHPESDKRILWDIGISKVLNLPPIDIPKLISLRQNHSDYTPRILETWYEPAAVCGMHKPVSAQLDTKGVRASQITAVIFR